MIHRYAIPFPVAPGRNDAQAGSIAAYFKANMGQYRESRRRLGTTMERMYRQATPMGSVVIAYVESEQGFVERMQALVASELEIDRRFIALLAEIHGVDVRQSQAGPPPQTIGEWVDPEVTTRRTGLAFMAPILPRKTALSPEDEEAKDTFAQDAYVTRRAEFIESRQALGQNAEVVTLTVTPKGSVICGYLEAADPVAASRRLVTSARPYDVWFKDHLRGRFPPEIDFSQPLPPIEPLFDYVADLTPAGSGQP